MSKLLSSTTLSQGTRYTGAFNTDFIVRDVENKMYLIEPYNYPLFQYLFLQKNKSIQTGHPLTKHEWPEDELIPALDTMSAAGTGGSTTMTVTPTEISLYRVGTKIRFEETDETGRVTSIDTSTFVATRDSGNWTNVSNGTNIHLIGEAYTEAQAPTSFVKTSKVMMYNYCQIFSKFVSMSERAVMASMNGGLYGGNDWEYEMDKKAKEIKRDIELAFWFNGSALASSSSNIYTTQTAGVIQQIVDGGGLVQPYEGSIGEDAFDNFLKQKKLGSNNATLFCGVDAAADIEKIVKARYSNIGPVKKYGAIDGSNNVDVITYSAVGKTVDIMRNPLWEGKYAKWAVLLDDEHVKLQHAAPDHKGSRKMRIEQLVKADGTPLKEAQFKSDVGVDVINAKTACILKPSV